MSSVIACGMRASGRCGNSRPMSPNAVSGCSSSSARTRAGRRVVVALEADEEPLDALALDGRAVAGQHATHVERAQPRHRRDEVGQRRQARARAAAGGVGVGVGEVQAGRRHGAGQQRVARVEVARRLDERDEVAGRVAGRVDRAQRRAARERELRAVGDRLDGVEGARLPAVLGRPPARRRRHPLDELRRDTVLDERPDARPATSVAPRLPARERGHVGGPGEDARALGGPAGGEPGVVEVLVGDEHGPHVRGGDAARGEQRDEQLPRPALGRPVPPSAR